MCFRFKLGAIIRSVAFSIFSKKSKINALYCRARSFPFPNNMNSQYIRYKQEDSEHEELVQSLKKHTPGRCKSDLKQPGKIFF